MTMLCRRNLSLLLFICVSFALIECNAQKQIPTTKFGHAKGGTMEFQYCYSCGYRKAFEDYVNILHEKYPELSVTGANYDPPGMHVYISKLIFALKIILIVIIVSSYDIFRVFGQQTPYWWRHLLENKIYACMMIFFVGNMIEAQFLATGAFEITLNGIPVWSKLETGRIPVPQELYQIIDNQLNLGDKIQENPNFVK